MNYFEFFDLTPQFQIDQKDLKRRYILNSKKFHPDFHGLQSIEEQDRILDLSTLNNKAYKTLADNMLRMKYILGLYEMMPEEGKAKIPQDFLMEMMDFNEKLMEMEFDDNPEAIKADLSKELDTMTDELSAEVLGNMKSWDKNPDQLELLIPIRDYYMKKKYLDRIREKL